MYKRQVGGLGDIVQEGNTCYIVEPDSVQIADSIIKFYNDSDKINFKENIKLYNKNFTWKKFIKVIESIIVK